MIQVFIQSIAGSCERRIYDEETLVYQRTRHTVLPHPYPYGFIPGTLAEDGDCLDCFVITRRSLEFGARVECEPLGLLEMKENGDRDHKVLAALKGEMVEVNDALLGELSVFLQGIFSQYPESRLEIGGIRSKEDTVRMMRAAGL
jgi:inorganic pyrophosphatase